MPNVSTRKKLQISTEKVTSFNCEEKPCHHNRPVGCRVSADGVPLGVSGERHPRRSGYSRLLGALSGANGKYCANHDAACILGYVGSVNGLVGASPRQKILCCHVGYSVFDKSGRHYAHGSYRAYVKTRISCLST